MVSNTRFSPKKYSEKELVNEQQSLIIKAAGKNIRINFEPYDHSLLKRLYLLWSEEIWKAGGFLINSNKVDFEIYIQPGLNQIEVIQKPGHKFYFLTVRKLFRKRRIITYYHVGPSVLQLVIKEVIEFLVKKDGLLLHASSCIDKQKVLHIFLAPSGGGKSTTARWFSKLGNKVQIFSDDTVVARIIEGSWVFFSPPFVEKDRLAQYRLAKKACFHFIKKGKKFNKQKIPFGPKLVSLVLEQVWQDDQKVSAVQLKNITKFSRENTFYLLTTVLDVKGFVENIYEN